MSIIEQAKDELKRANFGDEDSKVMIEILGMFFGQWDSSGAVHAVAPVLQRLIAGRPITPLTGDPEEWVEVMDGVYQNKRCSTVFKDSRFHEGKFAYDIDAPEPRAAITFPYWPDRAEVSDPTIIV